jgi:phospholipid-binding lipoprotein MlaA
MTEAARASGASFAGSRVGAAARRSVIGLLLAVLLATPAAQAQSGDRNPDPWESMNRGIFWANEKIDIYTLAPVARVWRFVTPRIFRTAVTNFNNNLQMPVAMANDLLQLKPRDAGFDLLRMAYNTSLGLGGIIDIATMVDIPENEADFGQTLGYWGCPPGPYFVIPVFGPSNVRDAVGRLGDFATTYYFSLLPFYATLLINGVEIVNLRSYYLEEIDENRREAFDYYVFMRNAYLQNRRSNVARARGEAESPGAIEEGLYYFEDDEEDEEDEWEEEREDGADAGQDAGEEPTDGSPDA